MSWQVLVLALGLVLIAEALLPALAPQLWLRLVKQLSQVHEKLLQRLALALLITGIIILGVVSICG